MDDLDRKILALLAKNARMPVKEIASTSWKRTASSAAIP